MCGIRSLMLAAATAAAAAMPAAAAAQNARPSQLVIVSALPDAATGLLTIAGRHFGTAPVVTLASMTLTVESATDSQIVADLPASIAHGTLGTYLLTVSAGAAATANWSVDLTLWAHGPAGPAGDQGARGDRGPVGPIGLTGAPGPRNQIPGTTGVAAEIFRVTPNGCGLTVGTPTTASSCTYQPAQNSVTSVTGPWSPPPPPPAPVSNCGPGEQSTLLSAVVTNKCSAEETVTAPDGTAQTVCTQSTVTTTASYQCKVLFVSVGKLVK